MVILHMVTRLVLQLVSYRKFIIQITLQSVWKSVQLSRVCSKGKCKEILIDPGDIIILLGGRTGRDGIGGATGASKAHNSGSLEECGAEVEG